MLNITRIAQLRTPDQFSNYLQQAQIELGFDADLQSGADAPLAQNYALKMANQVFNLSNRFCILPMEGWDGTTDGKPSALTLRRWERFGQSGAKLIWGGEAAAVRSDGRANPNQLVINQENLAEIAALRNALVAAHAQRWETDDLLIGLQLTHSGRFCRPLDKMGLAPKILYPHPVLNRKFNLPMDYPVMSDAEIDDLVGDFIQAARLAWQAGFAFVDLKHCHGYLGHEFLSAFERPGKYGGSFENRTRFLREVTAGIRSAAPGLEIGVRLSAFDFVPFKPGAEGTGIPDFPSGNPADGYDFAFGGDGTGLGIDLAEPHQFLSLLEQLEIPLVCITAGSPYYCPHVQRPALFPPSDGYQPPEDPLAGVARQIAVTAQLKALHPGLCVVGSGYSYLQEWLPNAAQHVVRTGQADFVGLGRMVLAYPDLCADVLEGKPLQRKRLCRTFSDCTTAPRKGLVSGCYPLDEFYKQRPEAKQL